MTYSVVILSPKGVETFRSDGMELEKAISIVRQQTEVARQHIKDFKPPIVYVEETQTVKHLPVHRNFAKL